MRPVRAVRAVRVPAYFYPSYCFLLSRSEKSKSADRRGPAAPHRSAERGSHVFRHLKSARAHGGRRPGRCYHTYQSVVGRSAARKAPFLRVKAGARASTHHAADQAVIRPQSNLGS